MEKGKLAFLVILIFSLTIFLSGCSSTPTNQSPSASFSANPTSGNAPLEVTFNASNSSDPDGSIISYEWDFGDGSTGSEETVTHTYQDAGDYTVELTVTDNDGATDFTSQTIDVSPPPSDPPTASFTASSTSGEAPLDVSFDASDSSDSDGNITSYSWNFGDGSNGSGETTNHTFNSSGDYTVKLTVTDNDGATDTDSAVISVSSSSQKAELVKWKLKKGNLFDPPHAKIEGTVKNVSNETLDVWIEAKFFNSSDVRIGESYNAVFGLSPGVSATFELQSTVEYRNVDRVEVKAEGNSTL